jgi:hypothetical protein
MRIVRVLALLALFLFPAFTISSAEATVPPMEEVPVVVPAKPKMYEFVKTANPKLAPSDVQYISKVLEEKATEYGLDLIVFAAVVAQESGYQLNLRVCHGQPGNCDIGLGQISTFWVKTWKLDTNRLRYDVTYNLDVSARILKSVHDENPTEKRAYSRYYNPNPRLRRDYERLVERWILVASR